MWLARAVPFEHLHLPFGRLQQHIPFAAIALRFEDFNLVPGFDESQRGHVGTGQSEIIDRLMGLRARVWPFERRFVALELEICRCCGQGTSGPLDIAGQTRAGGRVGQLCLALRRQGPDFLKLPAMLLIAIAAAHFTQADAATLYITVSGTVTDGEHNSTSTNGDYLGAVPYHQGDKFVASFAFDTNNPDLATPAVEMLTATGSSLSAQIANGKSPSPPDRFGIAFNNGVPESFPVYSYSVSKDNGPTGDSFDFQFASDDQPSQQSVFHIDPTGDFFHTNSVFENFNYITKPGDNFFFFLDQQYFVEGHPFGSIDNLFTGTNGGSGAPVTITVSTTAPGVVPEPGGWALMLAGFGLVGTAVRRRPVVGVSYA